MQTIPVIPNKKQALLSLLGAVLCVSLGCQHTKKVEKASQRAQVDAVERLKHMAPEQASMEIGEWRKQCKVGRAAYCYRIGRLFQRGIHLEENKHEALLLFQRACENKHKASCLMAGRLALDNSHSFYAPAIAISSYARGCQLKEARACFEAGVFWLLGEGEQESFNKAATYFGLSCRGEFGPACAHLGIMAQYGIGIAPSQNNAALLFEKGCSFLDPLSCFLASRAFRNQKSSAAQLKAIEYSELSCLGDEDRGCVIRGDLARQQLENAVAQKFYERACELENGIGCYRAGLISKEPTTFFEKACQKKVAEGCVAQGLQEMQTPKTSLTKVAGLFEIACTQNQALGCFQLFRFYKKNPQIIPRPDSLKRAKQAACLGGVQQACKAP